MPNTLQQEKSPITLLLTLVLLSMGTYLIVPAILMQLILELLDISVQGFFAELILGNSTPKHQYALIFIQAVSAFLSFIAVPVIFIKKYEFTSITTYFNSKNLKSISILITVGLTFALMVVNSFFIEWNMAFKFPEAIAKTIDAMEEQGKMMTEYIIDFQSFGYFLSVMIVVALIPAIGEEFLFRGLIQKYFQQIWNNPHVGIWLAAIFFSAFHLQFYGFIPRMLLGAFFGYLYYFSGNLTYAIIGHFINNGFTLMMAYLFQLNFISYDIERTESVPMQSITLFFVIGAILFVLFKKQFHITSNLQNE